jgi:hypothetical protein
MFNTKIIEKCVYCMTATDKSKKFCPASTKTSKPLGVLKSMDIPLKENVVEVSISTTTLNIFQLLIHNEPFHTPFGPGLDLHITSSEKQFQFQETTSDIQVIKNP